MTMNPSVFSPAEAKALCARLIDHNVPFKMNVTSSAFVFTYDAPIPATNLDK